jgi:hypothetical protein
MFSEHSYKGTEIPWRYVAAIPHPGFRMAQYNYNELQLDKFTLSQDELAFYKSQTGIQDENALKEHIIDVARRALKVQKTQAPT